MKLNRKQLALVQIVIKCENEMTEKNITIASIQNRKKNIVGNSQKTVESFEATLNTYQKECYRGFFEGTPVFAEPVSELKAKPALLPCRSSLAGRSFTYLEWKERGHQVREGSKMIGRNSKGEAVFDWHQVGIAEVSERAMTEAACNANRDF